MNKENAPRKKGVFFSNITILQYYIITKCMFFFILRLLLSDRLREPVYSIIFMPFCMKILFVGALLARRWPCRSKDWPLGV